MMQCMIEPLAKRKIRINAVSPGPMATDMVKKGWVGTNMEALEAGIPMKRVGTPEEVAKAVCFFADEEKAGYVTGANMRVAGGIGPGAWIA